MDAYGRGDKEAALRFIEEAYTRSPHIELVYDRARLEKELGRCEPALRHYRQYLKEAGEGASSGSARSAVRELDARCGRDDAKSGDDTMKIVGWSVIGAGVAAGVAGVYFALAGQEAQNDAEQILRRDEQLGKSWDSGYQREQDGRRDNTAATICVATAGTLIAGGAVILVLDSKSGPRSEQRFRVGAVRGGSLLTYTRAF